MNSKDQKAEDSIRRLFPVDLKKKKFTTCGCPF